MKTLLALLTIFTLTACKQGASNKTITTEPDYSEVYKKDEVDTQIAAATGTDLSDYATTVVTDALDADLTTVEGNISTLDADLTTAEANITTNAGNISTNATNISNNTSSISTNANSVSSNAIAISTNTTDIANNETASSNNTSSIAANTSNISNNSTDIATNITDISNLQTNVSTNTTNISANETDIATNVTDIATNTSDITDLESDADCYKWEDITGDASKFEEAGNDWNYRIRTSNNITTECSSVDSCQSIIGDVSSNSDDVLNYGNLTHTNIDFTYFSPGFFSGATGTEGVSQIWRKRVCYL